MAPGSRPLFRLGLDELSFLVTNRLPRRWATQFMGRLSRVRNRPLTALSVAIWNRFADLRLDESPPRKFESIQDCFTRELKPDARTVEAAPHVVVSPCDGIVGAHGRVRGTEVVQAKGFPYILGDLLQDDELVRRYRDGSYVTLRIRASMYHRFHAPADCSVHGVTYVSGDTWNVNPIALARVERLFCKNERAVIECRPKHLSGGLTLVPVAAILVAGIRLHCLEDVLDLSYRGPERVACRADYTKGDEMGWFQHGSTIIVFATREFELAPRLVEGEPIQMGQPLFLHRDRQGS